MENSLESEIEQIVDRQLQELGFIDLCTRIAHKVVEKVQKLDEEQSIVKHELSDIEQRLNLFFNEKKPLEKHKDVIVIEEDDEKPLIESLHAITKSQHNIPLSFEPEINSSKKETSDIIKYTSKTSGNNLKRSNQVFDSQTNISVGLKRTASGKFINRSDGNEIKDVNVKDNTKIMQGSLLQGSPSTKSLLNDRVSMVETVPFDDSPSWEPLHAEVTEKISRQSGDKESPIKNLEAFAKSQCAQANNKTSVSKDTKLEIAVSSVKDKMSINSVPLQSTNSLDIKLRNDSKSVLKAGTPKEPSETEKCLVEASEDKNEKENLKQNGQNKEEKVTKPHECIFEKTDKQTTEINQIESNEVLEKEGSKKVDKVPFEENAQSDVNISEITSTDSDSHVPEEENKKLVTASLSTEEADNNTKEKTVLTTGKADTAKNQTSTKIMFKEGDRVLGKPEKSDIWYPGAVAKVIVNKYGQKKFQVKFDSGQKIHGTLPINSLAPIENAEASELNVGSRIVASRPKDTVDARIAKKYVNLALSAYKTDVLFGGIIVEKACEENKNRFLVFFDDGFAQYLTVKKMHHVIYAAEKVWEDVSINCREFIKEYLEEYPDRPMVKLKTALTIQTEWNGRWLQARVVAVDASLVKMLFDIDKRTEWIYRGSTRLEPLYSELERRDLEAIKSKGKKSTKKKKPTTNQSKKIEPYIEDAITKPCFGVSKFSNTDPKGILQMKYWQRLTDELSSKSSEDNQTSESASSDKDSFFTPLKNSLDLETKLATPTTIPGAATTTMLAAAKPTTTSDTTTATTTPDETATSKIATPRSTLPASRNLKRKHDVDLSSQGSEDSFVDIIGLGCEPYGISDIEKEDSSQEPNSSDTQPYGSSREASPSSSASSLQRQLSLSSTNSNSSQSRHSSKKISRHDHQSSNQSAGSNQSNNQLTSSNQSSNHSISSNQSDFSDHSNNRLKNQPDRPESQPSRSRSNSISSNHSNRSPSRSSNHSISSNHSNCSPSQPSNPSISSDFSNRSESQPSRSRNNSASSNRSPSQSRNNSVNSNHSNCSSNQLSNHSTSSNRSNHSEFQPDRSSNHSISSNRSYRSESRSLRLFTSLSKSNSETKSGQLQETTKLTTTNSQESSLLRNRSTVEEKRDKSLPGMAYSGLSSSYQIGESPIKQIIALTHAVQSYRTIRPRKGPHECSPLCVPNVLFRFSERKKHNPLSVPLLLGWIRETAKRRPGYHRDIYYRSPCNRRLRNLAEVTQYLLQNKVTNVTIDQFSFDSSISCRDHLPSFETPRVKFDDISCGKETVPIPCVNLINNENPPIFEYIRERSVGSKIKLNTDPGFLACCECDDMCQDKTKCPCARLTIDASDAIDGTKDDDCGYQYRRLKECVTTGIYECNRQCSCKSSCYNRVVQNGIRLRLQIFMTDQKGWGLRCLDDIARGTFVCTYTGQILNEEMADKEGTDFGDEYLAELDHIEIVEQLKDGYESDVPELRDEKKSIGSLSSENSNKESDSDESESSSSTSSESSDNIQERNSLQKEELKCPSPASNVQRATHQTTKSPRELFGFIDLTLDSDDDDEIEAKSPTPQEINKIVLEMSVDSNDDSNYTTQSSLEGLISKLKTKVIEDKTSPGQVQETPRSHRQQKESLIQRSDERIANKETPKKTLEVPSDSVAEPDECSPASSTFDSDKEIIKAAKEIAPQLRKAVARKSTKSILQMLVNRRAKCDIDKSEAKLSERISPPVLDRVANADVGPCKKFTSPRSSTGGHFARKITSRHQVTPPNQASVDKKEPENDGTRKFFEEDQCYVIDAKSFGNVGRFLNHSCMPNLFVQNVFADTHDLRFPLVAFFAQQNIPALTELTWDYSYDVGSVPGKVLICHCGSLECRGRLL